MVDVVCGPLVASELEDVIDGVNHVLGPKGHIGFGNLLSELAVQTESPDRPQPITVGVEEPVVEELFGFCHVGGVARTKSLEDALESVLVTDRVVLTQGIQQQGVFQVPDYLDFLDAHVLENANILVVETRVLVVTRADKHLARLRMHDVGDRDLPF